MTRATLLVELQTEELPPKALKTLGAAFAERIVHGLDDGGFIDRAHVVFEVFATPRRLGIAVRDVLEQAANRKLTDKLMPQSVALDAGGNPTPALIKRLEKIGRRGILEQPEWTDGPDHVYVAGEGKAAAVYFRTLATGRRLGMALESIVDDALAKLPIPKRMNYQRYDEAGAETTVQFVRPAHGVLALHGPDVVPIRVLGLDASRTTIGHRFIGMERVSIAQADDYVKTLYKDGKVVAGFAERHDAIRARLIEVAGDDRVVMPDALLDEVTALVEWPAVYRGTFDEAFLGVPQECLVLTMQQNQKYFALTDQAGKLVNRFLVVSNIETDEPSLIVGGNERVLRARLADAKFFFDQDRKRTLESRVDQLKTVVYHNKLGTQYERMQRVEALAGRIARMIEGDVHEARATDAGVTDPQVTDATVTNARRAARLAKTDLVTDMVGEFPELQGLMGRYYARHDGEAADVAAAIEEQYKPRFAGDALPATSTGTALALADKLETLVGLFGIGAVPTGDKDPFALRRHALGVLRIAIEGDLRIDLLDLLNAAIDASPPKEVAREVVVATLVEFMRVRLAGTLRDLGYSANEVEAVVFDVGAGPLADIPRRLAAVRAFVALPESASLASADKRVRNILAKTAGAQGHAFDRTLLTADAELALSRALDAVEPRSESAFVAGDFEGSLIALASLKGPVDRFFDEVMVNADDPLVRANRLGLLEALHVRMKRVADLSRLAA